MERTTLLVPRFFTVRVTVAGSLSLNRTRAPRRIALRLRPESAGAVRSAAAIPAGAGVTRPPSAGGGLPEAPGVVVGVAVGVALGVVVGVALGVGVGVDRRRP